MSEDEYIAGLVRTFLDRYGCEATYLETDPVALPRSDRIVWDGLVDSFELKGHPQTRKGYAWTWVEDGENRTIALLELPPVVSPETAVRVALGRDGVASEEGRSGAAEGPTTFLSRITFRKISRLRLF